MKVRDHIPTADNATNFNVASDSTTNVGSTLDNLKTAVAGETGAAAKYEAFAKAAEAQGYPQLAKLFAITAEAEKIHIGLEYDLIIKEEPDYVKPTVDAPDAEAADLNLVNAAYGEMYEMSDMYTSFIKKAQEEGNKQAEQVFTRAKLAEGVHAELYLQAYNDLDAPDDEDYYLCPICGFIHKGKDFDKCPICFTPETLFKQI